MTSFNALVNSLRQYKGEFVKYGLKSPEPEGELLRHKTRVDANGKPACPLVVLGEDVSGQKLMNVMSFTFEKLLELTDPTRTRLMKAADHSTSPDRQTLEEALL